MQKEDGEPGKLPYINFFYQSVNFLVLALMLISHFRKNSLRLVFPQVLLLILRIEMSMLDFEGKRFDETLNTNMFIMMAIITIGVFIILLNSILNRKIYIVPLSALVCFVAAIGQQIMQGKLEGSFSEILSQIFFEQDNFSAFLGVFGQSFIACIVMDYILSLGQNSIFKAWNASNTAQKEYQFILSELQEAIFTKDSV